MGLFGPGDFPGGRLGPQEGSQRAVELRVDGAFVADETLEVGGVGQDRRAARVRGIDGLAAGVGGAGPLGGVAFE